MTEDEMMKLIADELWKQGGAHYRRDGDHAFADRPINLRELAKALLYYAYPTRVGGAK